MTPSETGALNDSVWCIIGNDYLASVDNLIMKDGKYEHFVEKFMNTLQQIESLKSLPDPSTFNIEFNDQRFSFYDLS